MFEIGDVLQVQWDDRAIRVIMTDSLETYYDVFWSNDIGWGLARARTAIYYRIPTILIEAGAKKLRSEPLSERELKKHRPDLPMRLLQRNKASLSDDSNMAFGGITPAMKLKQAA